METMLIMTAKSNMFNHEDHVKNGQPCPRYDKDVLTMVKHVHGVKTVSTMTMV